MGGIVAVIDLSGADPGKGSALAISEPEAHRGIPSAFDGPGISLIARSWIHEEHPLAVEDGVAVAVHGYLFGPEHPASAQRLLSRYLEAGEGAFSEIDGEFAFVAWDGRSGHLYLGRDSFGTKPLFRSRTGHRIIAATEARQALRARPGGQQLEYDHLRMLLDAGTAPERPWETVIRGIHRVLPGQVQKISTTGEAFWQPWEPPRHIDESLTPETVSRLIPEVLRRSVRRRRLNRPAFLMSGGLDSTYVAATSVSDPELRVRFGPKPTALTHVAPGHPVDETERSRQVARHLGLRHITYEVSCDDLGAEIRRLLRFCDHPLGLPGPGVLPPLEIGAREGIGTFVGGIGGDSFWHFTETQISPWDLPLAAGIAHSARRLLTALHHGPRWALRALGAIVADRRRGRGNYSTWTWARRERMLVEFCHGIYEGREQAAARFGITYSEPFLDREMAELAFRTHPRHLQRPKDRKRLLAVAARGLLPPSFVESWCPVHYSGFLARAMGAQTNLLFAYPRFLDENSLRHASDFVADDSIDAYWGEQGRFLRFLALAIWLEMRGVEGAQRSMAPSATASTAGGA
ncbi:MAG: hypothetical protein HY900_30255 [Deltaproteobacteria bacterium]|nr:hypothetical protein [Deltaproteobacteria bacterium]